MFFVLVDLTTVCQQHSPRDLAGSWNKTALSSRRQGPFGQLFNFVAQSFLGQGHLGEKARLFLEDNLRNALENVALAELSL
jgi:hypothetical protein